MDPKPVKVSFPDGSEDLGILVDENLLDVGTIGLNPLDMGGLKTDALPPKSHVMAAHATAIFVGQQDFFPERRIPASRLVRSDQRLIRIEIP